MISGGARRESSSSQSQCCNWWWKPKSLHCRLTQTILILWCKGYISWFGLFAISHVLEKLGFKPFSKGLVECATLVVESIQQIVVVAETWPASCHQRGFRNVFLKPQTHKCEDQHLIKSWNNLDSPVPTIQNLFHEWEKKYWVQSKHLFKKENLFCCQVEEGSCSCGA